MDLVSLETSAENEWIKKHLVEDKVFWNYFIVKEKSNNRFISISWSFKPGNLLF